MISHVTLGVSDFEKSLQFYDSILSVINFKRRHSVGKLMFYGEKDSVGPWLAIGLPFNREKASPGNGVMVSLKAEGISQVHKDYEPALQMGDTCEGEPKIKGMDQGRAVYGAFFRNINMNKPAIMCWVSVEDVDEKTLLEAKNVVERIEKSKVAKSRYRQREYEKATT